MKLTVADMTVAVRQVRLLLFGFLLAGVACRRAEAQAAEGRLVFKAHAPTQKVHPGMMPLGLDSVRDGFLLVPHDNAARHPAPLLVLLHGATQRARLFERFAPLADSLDVAILAVDSRAMTWDAVRDTFGPDVEFLQRAIGRSFDRAYIDSCRVVIGGFSDGASYALSLGIRNADVFHGVVAFSPGFVIPAPNPQKVPVFLRHGVRDQILAIESTSRPILNALRAEHFDVDYAEFDGPHTIRPLDGRASLEWVKERTC